MIRRKQNKTPDDLLAYQRWCWRPFLKESKSDSPYDSKFGGVPYFSEAECAMSTPSSPNCGRCKKPLTLVLQIHLGRLPAVCHLFTETTGVFQVFYCAQDKRCEAATSYCRVIPISKHPQPQVYSNDAPLVITAWQKMPDFPTQIEAQAFDLPISSSSWEEVESAGFHACQGESKLGGWPAWENQVDYPRCAICESPLQHLFQIAYFGREEKAWVARCSEHRKEITLFCEPGNKECELQREGRTKR